MKFDSFSLDKKNQYFLDENGHYKLKIQKENLPTKKSEKSSRRRDRPDTQNGLKEASENGKQTMKPDAERAKPDSKKGGAFKNNPSRIKNNENLLRAKNMNGSIGNRNVVNGSLTYKNMNLNGPAFGKMPLNGVLGRMPLTGTLGTVGKKKPALGAKKKGNLKENALKRF